MRKAPTMTLNKLSILFLLTFPLVGIAESSVQDPDLARRKAIVKRLAQAEMNDMDPRKELSKSTIRALELEAFRLAYAAEKKLKDKLSEAKIEHDKVLSEAKIEHDKVLEENTSLRAENESNHKENRKRKLVLDDLGMEYSSLNNKYKMLLSSRDEHKEKVELSAEVAKEQKYLAIKLAVIASIVLSVLTLGTIIIRMVRAAYKKRNNELEIAQEERKNELEIAQEERKNAHLEKIRIMSERAGEGDLVSQYTLGDMYLKGLDVPKDLSEAKKWHIMAAEQGHADSQFYMGKHYRIERNNKEAVIMYLKAANQGHEDALRMVKIIHGEQVELQGEIEWFTSNNYEASA